MRRSVKEGVLHRLKIIEGQVRGLQKMIADETYCIDVIVQISAVRRALASVEDTMLENHLSTHLIDHVKTGKQSRAVREILAVYKLSKRK